MEKSNEVALGALLTREQIMQKLRSVKRTVGVSPWSEVRLSDVARYLGISYRYVKYHARGQAKISNEQQIRYTRFFELHDAGRIDVVNAPEGRCLVLLPASRAKPPPKKPLLPRIDFGGKVGPVLKLD